MRLLLLSFLLLLSLSAFAQQRISGRITDTDDKPIEYVNVGIAETSVGVISDGAGNFSIRVPDSLAGRNVLFSHLSYGLLEVPAEELARRTASGEEVVVRLPESGFTIPEIVIRPGRIRHRNFGKILRISRGAYRAHADTVNMSGEMLQAMNKEIGTIYSVKERIWLK